MSALRGGATLLVLAVLAAACRKTGDASPDAAGKDSAGLDQRVQRLEQALAEADSGDARGKPVARWLLPPELTEVSGLALTPDGRLFAHNDEASRVTELDYRRGTVVKSFYIGKEAVRDDFEGLAVAGDRFYLLASDGKLYEFREGADGERVDFRVHDTRLGRECEFEGVAFDSTSNSLVLACKNVGVRNLEGFVVLYRYSLGDSTAGKISDLKIPLSQAIGKNPWKRLRPTDIAVDPWSGNYVMVSAQEKGILIVDPTGTVVLSRALSGRHPQTEGIAITRDSILILGDEGTAQPGTITLYRWPWP